MKYVLQVDDGRAAIIGPDARGFWYWEASFLDGSGMERDWCLTKRGAQMRAISEYRWKAKNYRPTKFKWKAEE